MKTQLILKTAVVAMAAFGAFAFGGTNRQQTPPFTEAYYLDSENGCTNIEARCSKLSSGVVCQILVNGKTMPVFDFDCEINLKHNNSSPVEWK
ncbi:hypothetical protein [Gelidibacter gilvus]|uniref:Uncharacterized protein n=1 Tax=Gelidibacter gilvus TaxID=59602 RepID=A0A4Q0XF89_9FLAO|nr:hypothetical protein [Gelidibacter gilvus]RXJ45386.1 hypothetical protein ESZ48_16340 [Gelidibacter gilvus]